MLINELDIFFAEKKKLMTEAKKKGYSSHGCISIIQGAG
jgi:hypothetical protein